MALSWPFKDPDEVLDYFIDWTARLAGDTISSSLWFIVDDDLTLTIDSNSFTASGATVWLSGGTIGVTYEVTNRIMTAGARTMDQTVKLKIKGK